jgi:hypothetical protein
MHHTGSRQLVGLACRSSGLLLLAALLGGCISPTSYIDPALPNLRAQDIAPVGSPKPVQLLYEFRTKGAANARATERSKPIVMETMQKSGLFSSVSETPVAGGGTLTMVIDNISLTDDAVGKGFRTGLTFGLVGNMVTDGYVCTATYSAGGKVASTTVKHAMHTTVGNASGPPGIEPMKPNEAVPIMLRQITLNALQGLRKEGM